MNFTIQSFVKIIVLLCCLNLIIGCLQCDSKFTVQKYIQALKKANNIKLANELNKEYYKTTSFS